MGEDVDWGLEDLWIGGVTVPLLEGYYWLVGNHFGLVIIFYAGRKEREKKERRKIH